MKRKLKMGMVGGGRGSFIGGVHRMAANLDGKIELVAGCFSADPEKSRLSGEDFFLNPKRVYDTYETMIREEAKLPVGERIDFVSIVTRNNSHFRIAKAFLEGGFNVICDKPVTFNLAEALELREIVQKSGKVFALTHNYTGYPMVKEAREMVRSGRLGRILKAVVEYPQGYAIGGVVAEAPEAISSWRTDPSVAGASNCIADIGIHAENLLAYISGLEIDELCADLSVFAPGKQLDDDGSVLLRFKNGAKGLLFASQISSGDENNLNVRIWGTQGSLQWFQEHPNELIFKAADQPHQIYRRGNSYLSGIAKANSRTPFGHQEAFIEAFANVYMNAAKAIADEVSGKGYQSGQYDFPGIDEGVHGMAFIDTVLKSSASEAKWLKFPAL
jgi:predicted dehydrogenase